MSAYTLRMVVIVLSVLSSLFLLKKNPAMCAPPYQITIKQWEGQICSSYFTNLKKYINI